MRSAGLAIKNKEFIDLKDLSVMFDEAIKAIIKTRKASVGQKTILDTFTPRDNRPRSFFRLFNY
jgi:dihydroxyacetone kinase